MDAAPGHHVHSPHIGLPARPAWRGRTPRPPAPIEPFDLCHASVPEALDGLTVLHLSDTHVERINRRSGYHRDLVRALPHVRPDLIVHTGDFMTMPGDELAALDALKELADHWNPRFGAFGIPGNHDTALFLRHARRVHGFRLLEHESVKIPIDLGRGGCELAIVGSGFPESLLAASRGADCFTLTLVHYPSEIYAAAQLGLPLVLSGHTHGGQIRTHAALAPHTSCDLPGNLASGIFRLRDTLLCISRGLGVAIVPLRLQCAPQAPLYTLKRAPTPGSPCDRLEPIRRW